MAAQPLSDELAQQAVDAFKQFPNNKSEAARSLGLSRNAFRGRLESAAARGMLGFDEMLPGFVAKSVSTQIGDSWVRQVKEAGEVFEMPAGHVAKGVSVLLDPDDRVIQKWVKTKPSDRSEAETIAAIKSAFADWTIPPEPNPDPGKTDLDRLTVYPIADAHLGLKAVSDESGAEYNLQIAEERFRSTTARLFDRSPNSDTALILQLGDWTHADDELAMTPTSKNILQVSDRQLPTIRSGVRLMKDYIYQALRKHRNVIVKVLRGNHDLNAWIALYVALEEHFHDNDRVTIDGGAADYWFFRFGSTLIGAHHGHRLKPAEMAGAMATECREDWGETLYRLFLHGHLHHMITQEVLGVRVECFRTLAEADAHHAGKYGSGKSLVSITIHKSDGEDGRVQINLPPVKKRAANAGIL